MKKDWQNHFHPWVPRIQNHMVSETDLLVPSCLKTLVSPWTPATHMHFLLCKKSKPRGQHLTLTPARSWVRDIWLWSKSKLLSTNAGWQGNASRKRVWSPFWAFLWETADRRAAPGELHCCLAAANCSTFSDLRLPGLGRVIVVVYILVWIQYELPRFVLPGFAPGSTGASLLPNTFLRAYLLPVLSISGSRSRCWLLGAKSSSVWAISSPYSSSQSSCNLRTAHSSCWQ